MNSSILKKILGELQSPSPRLDYCIGMLETLIEMNDPNKPIIEQSAKNIPRHIPVVSDNKDEAALMDAKARAALKTVQELAAQSAETV